MGKQSLFLIAALFISAAAYSQTELGENEHYATVIFPNGNEQEVVLLENLDYPWDLQKKITTVEKGLFESGTKIKGKHKISYKAKDLKGFKIGEQLYETRKYSDMSSVSMSSLGGKYFLEVVESGKISLYKYYQEPYTEEGAPPVTREELNQKFRNHPQILIYKDGLKVKEVTSVKLEPYFGDNQKVMDKYNEGGYGNKPKDPEKSGAGKLWDRITEDNKEFVKAMLKDYNDEEAL